MAGPKGGLRSGPAANTIWSKAFQLLGVGLLKQVAMQELQQILPIS